jgi:hypothetical protein
VGSLTQKCREDTNTGYEKHVDEEGNIIETDIPLKDIVICYDEKKKLFTCNNIHTVLSDIQKFDNKVIKKLPYDKKFVAKMRERYQEEINAKKVEKVEVVGRETHRLTFSQLYGVLIIHNQDYYDTESLKNKYKAIFFEEYKASEIPDIIEHFEIQNIPSVVLIKNEFGKYMKVASITSLEERKIIKLIDTYTEEQEILLEEEDDEILFPVEKIIDQLEESKFSIEIPYTDIKDMDKKALVEQVAKTVHSGELSFPYVKLFLKDPSSFVNRKTKAKWGNIQINSKKGGLMFYKPQKGILTYDEDYENIDILSSYFTDEARMQAVFTKDGNTKSPLELWKSEIKRIAGEAYEYSISKKKGFDAKALREGMYMARIPECTTFKISLAIKIYDEFKPKIVFDPFAGWGDRALGTLFSETVKTYIGTDPNSLLVPGYSEIRSYANKYFQEKKIIFEHTPIETFNYDKYFSSKNIDLVFSSPPYFDYEIYTNESTQSISSHSSSEKWTNWFHTQTYRAFSYLKNGGYLVYYLGNSKNLDITGNLIEYMKTRPHAEFKGIIPTISADRKNRPLFFYVWQKVKEEKI